DAYTEQRLWNEQPREGEQSAVADLLGTVDAAIGKPGQGLDADMQALFDSFARLASDPTSTIARQTVFSQAASLGASFRSMHEQLTAAGNNADVQVRAVVTDVNNLADQIATLNGALADVGGDSTTRGMAVAD